MAEHNHLTRDIRPLWSGCHGCDEYHVNALQMRIAGLLAERDAARAEVAALRKQEWAEPYRREVLADLRAKVEGLRDGALEGFRSQPHRSHLGTMASTLERVLALIEEAGR